MLTRTDRAALAAMRLEEATGYEDAARWAHDNGRSNTARVLARIAKALRAEARKYSEEV